MVANEGLAQAVKMALDADTNLRSYGLDVKAEGNLVTVSGVVDVLSEKWHAEKVAKSVSGVQNVEAAITVSTDGQIDDSDVRFEVGEELGLYPDDELRELSIEASKGVVTLRGVLSESDLKQQAMEAAAKARGVVDVISKIEVKD